MSRAALIMYAVAGTAGATGLGLLFVRAQGEAAVYARRIAATMLLAIALVLGVFAHALASWGPGA